MKFYATFEQISETRGIVEITDAAGQWMGGGIVETGRSKRALYDLAYDDACARASIHGGQLDVFRTV